MSRGTERRPRLPERESATLRGDREYARYDRNGIAGLVSNTSSDNAQSDDDRTPEGRCDRVHLELERAALALLTGAGLERRSLGLWLHCQGRSQVVA